MQLLTSTKICYALSQEKHKKPIVLVGCQSDSDKAEGLVEYVDAEKVGEALGAHYIECSAK